MICVVPGSFDPLTKGHEDLIKRCAEMFDKVYVAISDNPTKRSLDATQRLRLAEKVLCLLENVYVEINNGISAEYAKSKGAALLVKGVRNATDFEYEAELAKYNRELYEVETLLLPSADENIRISSSMVRELVLLNCDVKAYVPKEIYKDIMVLYGGKNDK